MADLRNDQQVAKSDAAAGPGECVFAFESVASRARGGPRGARPSSRPLITLRAKEEQYPPIDATLTSRGTGSGQSERGECGRGPQGEKDSKSAAAETEQQALHEHLPLQPARVAPKARRTAMSR
jgi:hypothetical protein